jgi:hypothetical protein
VLDLIIRERRDSSLKLVSKMDLFDLQTQLLGLRLLLIVLVVHFDRRSRVQPRHKRLARCPHLFF